MAASALFRLRLSAFKPSGLCRNYATEPFVVAPPTPTPVVAVPPPPPGPRRPSSFRGGILGFLFGFSLASSFAAYSLLEEYQKASSALQSSVLELKSSTEKIATHVRRIEIVEKDLKALGNLTADKEQLASLRAETRKIYDGLHVEFLDLRSHVWGIQQDLHALSKKDGTTHRV